MTDSQSINNRFLAAIDAIAKDRSEGKITKTMIGERIGIKPISNLTRLANQKPGQQRSVTAEQCARLCDEFFISPEWLLLGIGPMQSDPPSPGSALDAKIDEVAQIVAGLVIKVNRLENARK